VMQVPRVDWPFTQAGAALAKGVAGVLHAPQLPTSVFRFASQPLLATPSQSANLQDISRNECNDQLDLEPTVCCASSQQVP
jgi:hypothetical protein